MSADQRAGTASQEHTQAILERACHQAAEQRQLPVRTSSIPASADEEKAGKDDAAPQMKSVNVLVKTVGRATSLPSGSSTTDAATISTATVRDAEFVALMRQKQDLETRLAVQKVKFQQQLDILSKNMTSNALVQIEIRKIRSEHNTQTSQLHNDHQKEVHSLHENYGKLMEGYESRLTTMQEKAFSTVEAAQWKGESLEDVSRQLNAQCAAIKQWVERFSNSAPFSLPASSPALHKLAQSLHNAGCTGSSEHLATLLQKRPFQPKTGRPASLLLTALLTAHTFAALFDDPFFAFVSADPEMQALRAQDGIGLRATYDLIASYDFVGAQSWRCQLIRLLDPVTGAHGAELEGIKVRALNSRLMAADRLSTDSYNLVAAFINAAQESDARQKLAEICLEVAELAWKLFSQRPLIRVMTHQRLAEYSDKGSSLVYHEENVLMEPHQLHRKVLEDNENALDGTKVRLVCQPAVVALESDVRQSATDMKVLRKATVWMG